MKWTAIASRCDRAVIKVNQNYRLRSWIVVICFVVIAPPAVPNCVACSWDYFIWTIRSKSADPLYRFVRDGKAGYIDRNGKIVIEPTFPGAYGNHGGEFHDGLLCTSLVEAHYVNSSGKPAFNKQYYRAYDFSEGLAVAGDEYAEKWGYINTSGDFVITPRFDFAYSFSEGLARIKVDNKFGYTDRAGRIVIPPQFVLSDDFHDGMARVVTEGPCTYISEGPCADREVLPENAPHSGQYPPCKCGFIDRTGRLLTTRRYDSAKEFSEGLAPVQVGNKWGYIDKKGQIVIEPKFDEARPFSEGFALVHQGRLAGFIDRTGAFVIPADFDYAEDFSDGLAVVGLWLISFKEDKGHFDRSFWYINKEGKQAIPEAFDLAGSFVKGLAHVRLKSHKKDEDGESSEAGPFAYINTTGKTVFTY